MLISVFMFFGVVIGVKILEDLEWFILRFTSILCFLFCGGCLFVDISLFVLFPSFSKIYFLKVLFVLKAGSRNN